MPKIRNGFGWVPLLLTAASNCSSEAKEAEPNEAAGGRDGAAGNGGALDPADDSLPTLGTFAVSLIAADGSSNTDAFSSVLGRVYESQIPEAIQWTVVDEGNGCELVTPSAPFCDPGCGASAVCVAESDCEPYPKALDLGAVTVSGLGSDEFSMTPIAGAYQPPASVHLPYPPTEEGAAIGVATEGGALDPFVLTGRGISPLELLGEARLALGPDIPLDLEWTPPGDVSLSRILVKVDISHHGGLKGQINCDAADSGSLQIPAKLTAELIGLGTAGFPTVAVTRVSTAATAVETGRVRLTVSSMVERPLDVPGIVSCNGDDDCPTGSCQMDRTCQ